MSIEEGYFKGEKSWGQFWTDQNVTPTPFLETVGNVSELSAKYPLWEQRHTHTCKNTTLEPFVAKMLEVIT